MVGQHLSYVNKIVKCLRGVTNSFGETSKGTKTDKYGGRKKKGEE